MCLTFVKKHLYEPKSFGKEFLWTDFSRLWRETLNSWWKRDCLGGPASGRLAVIDAVYVYQEVLKVNISHQAHLSITKTHQIHL